MRRRHSPTPIPGNAHHRFVLRSGPLYTTLFLSNDGRIAAKTETVSGREAAWQYVYDTHGRLDRAMLDGQVVEEYRYGARGERVADQCACRNHNQRALTYARDGRLVRAGDRGYLFDSHGRLGAVQGPRGAIHLIYDESGGLAQAHLANGLVVTQRTGPGGLPLEKLVNDQLAERFHWLDMTRLSQWDDLRRGVTMRFAYDKGRVPVAVSVATDEGETEYALGADQTGTIKVVADPHGHLIQHIQYDSFGNVLSNTNPTFRLPLGFAGGLVDHYTGLVRFGYRDYDPAIGRFTAPDPLGDTGGDHDPWEYCVDDPVNAVDPLGLKDKGLENIDKASKAAKALDALNTASGVAGMVDETIKADKNLNELHKNWEDAIKSSDTSQWDWEYLEDDYPKDATDAVVKSSGKIIKEGSKVAH